MGADEEFSAANGETPDDDYALVYPFVVCKSNGGPYDDDSFVAGARFAQIDAELQLAHMLAHDHSATVEPALVPQLELLAMHRGYTLRIEEFDGEDLGVRDAWARAVFELTTDDTLGEA